MQDQSKYFLANWQIHERLEQILPSKQQLHERSEQKPTNKKAATWEIRANTS